MNDSACLLLDFASGAHAVIHVGLPHIVGPGLSHTGQTVIISGHYGTPGDPLRSVDWSRRGRLGDRRPASWSGTRRNPHHPDDYFGGTPRDDAFAVFRRQSVGPRFVP